MAGAVVPLIAAGVGYGAYKDSLGGDATKAQSLATNEASKMLLGDLGRVPTPAPLPKVNIGDDGGVSLAPSAAPQPRPIGGGGLLGNARTLGLLTTAVGAPQLLAMKMAQDAEANKPFDLSPGQQRYAGGKLIASAPFQPTEFDKLVTGAGWAAGSPEAQAAARAAITQKTYVPNLDPNQINLTRAQTYAANANAAQSRAGAAKDAAETAKLNNPDIAARYKQMFGNEVPAGYTPALDAKGMPTGAVVPMAGGPSDPSRQPSKFNNDQNKAAGYANSMSDAEARLEGIGTGAPGKPDFVPFDPTSTKEAARGVSNITASPQYQQYKQAGMDWTLALLRHESGANVPESEAEKYWKTYFPQVGDSKQVIAQKAQSRATKMRGVVAASGGAYDTLRKSPAAPATPETGGAVAANAPINAQAIVDELRRRGAVK